MPDRPAAPHGQGGVHSERVMAACVEAIDETFEVHDGATHEQLAHAVLHAYAAVRGFRDMEADLRTTLDRHYPVDLIPGPYRPGADPGVRFVVKLREALAELPEEPPHA